MKISTREALFGGEEVDDWTPTASWEDYFTMLPDGSGTLGSDGWTQEQLDMLWERFGKDKFRPDGNRLLNHNGRWIALTLESDGELTVEDYTAPSAFGVGSFKFPALMSKNHMALVVNRNMPQAKLEEVLPQVAQKLDDILSSDSKTKIAGESGKSLQEL